MVLSVASLDHYIGPLDEMVETKSITLYGKQGVILDTD